MTIGETIRKLRKDRKLTQDKLGKLCGIDQHAISAYEHNKNIPTIFNLISLADALHVSLDELVGRRFP